MERTQLKTLSSNEIIYTKLESSKYLLVILRMVLSYRQAAVEARHVYGTFLWVVYRDLGYLLRLCPHPVPYNRKYKKSCQETRVLDSPKGKITPGKPKILCFLHIALAFFNPAQRNSSYSRQYVSFIWGPA